jgi:heme/copper-type cytochrome/quinol oxidase subunit 2
MGALATAILLAAEKTPAEEGRDVVLVMLLVGFVFIGVVLVGQLARWAGHRRKAKRAAHRAY